MKKILLAFVSLILISSANAQQLTDSLLLYYPFTGNMNDASGNGFDATGGTATLTQDRFSNANSAYSFNGINETIDLPNQSALRPQLPVTISLWIKVDTLTGTGGTAFWNDFQNNNYVGCWLGIRQNGTISLGYGAGIGGASPNNRRSKFGSISIDDGSWHHVVGILRSALDMEIWIDCVEDTNAVYSGTGGNLAYLGSAGKIGVFESGALLYLDGDLDEIRFWNRDITTAEIDSLCNEGSVGINELAVANPFTIYPNPTAGKFTVSSGQLAANAVLELYDISGRAVGSWQLAASKKEVDVSHLAKGMYYVKLGDAVRKLVIE